jgi:hypothetical protein
VVSDGELDFCKYLNNTKPCSCNLASGGWHEDFYDISVWVSHFGVVFYKLTHRSADAISFAQSFFLNQAFLDQWKA